MVKRIAIGKSGITASQVTLGTIGFGAQGSPIQTASQVQELLQACLSHGIDWVDTAVVYGVGASETLLGEAIAAIGREKLVLQTKCGLNWRSKEGEFEYLREGTEVYRDLRPAAIRADLEDSLRRLRTDYIDVYVTHRQQPSVPLEDTIAELVKMKEQGKIRAIGASNLTPEQMQAYGESGVLDIIQQKYSLLDQDAEHTHFPLCARYGVTFQGWGILEHGVLTGRPIAAAAEQPQGPVPLAQVWQLPQVAPHVNALFEKWAQYCQAYGCSFVNLVQALTLSRCENQSLLVGLRTKDHIEQAVRAVELQLAPEDAAAMMRDVQAVLSHAPEHILKPFR